VERDRAARHRLLEEARGDRQRRAVREVDKAWMAMLWPLGIEKGKPFKPDQRQRAALLRGAAMGELMNRNQQINTRYTKPYWDGTSSSDRRRPRGSSATT
jgi:hypothetical protein